MQVHQRSTAVARINGRVGLYGIGNGGAALPFGDGASQCADDAIRHRLRYPQRVTYCQHLLPHTELRGVSYSCYCHVAGWLDLQYCQVIRRIGARQLGRQFRTIVQDHLNGLRTVDYVIIRDDVPTTVDDDTGADSSTVLG